MSMERAKRLDEAFEVGDTDRTLAVCHPTVNRIEMRKVETILTACSLECKVPSPMAGIEPVPLGRGNVDIWQ